MRRLLKVKCGDGNGCLPIPIYGWSFGCGRRSWSVQFSGRFQRLQSDSDALDGQEKMAFITEWRVFVAVVMIFGLKMAPTTFQRIIMEIFGEFIPAFMQVFLDDFAVYSREGEHLQHLRLCLEKCRAYRLSLNPVKCVFGVSSGALLGHIVSKDGIAVDPHKVKAILEAPTPTTAKALSQFLGQIRWHSWMLWYLADLAFMIKRLETSQDVIVIYLSLINHWFSLMPVLQKKGKFCKSKVG